MSNYWRKRFELLEQKSNEYGLEAFRQIEPAFINAEKEIQKEIEAWYGRYARNNGVSMNEARRQLSTKELKEFRWDVNEYIKYGRENAIDPKWMKELENASARVHINRLEALKIRTQQAAEAAFGNELDVIDEMARKVYTEDYYHSIFEMHKGFGVGWNVGQVDERKLGQLISKPWAADGKNFSQRIWNYRDQLVNELHTQMTQACVLGKHPKQLIDSISKKFKTTKGQAGRLVMTEQAFFHSAAQKDAFKELDVEEFEVVATLDSSTSDICQDMDGQHFKMSEFEVGVTAPPFHCWCRSVTAPYFEDNYGGERAARGADGKTYYVPDDMKYKDWKEHFVDKTKDPADWLKRVDVSDVKKFDDSFVDTALEWYVSGQGQWVNQYLRNPEEWKADYDITDDELELIEAMKQGTNSEIVQESVLYRSVDASAVFGKMSQAEFENLRDFVVYNDKNKYAMQAKAKFLDGIEGKEIVEKGFLSTTKEMDVALEWGDYTGSDKAITLELKVPKGIKGKDLKKFEVEGDEQFEVLLAPGQKYKIKEITAKEGQIYVKADLIVDDVESAPDVVESALGIKKKEPMTMREAVKGSNPYYSKDVKYRVNCQRCVQTYELRRRGYDVIALPKKMRNNEISWGSECFIPSDKQKKAVREFTWGKTAAQIKKELENADDGARYVIYVQWKNVRNSAHVFIGEKYNGIVHYIDPQDGSEDVVGYFERGSRNKFGFFRLDDKPITDDENIIKATVEVRKDD